ncbi:hypothetical protein ACFZA2_01930 [Microbacterium sp. NPDC007973]|uniref:hypothetical protein n=1 Tax=Microbacterium sp. NPDC007973 TaxID=3364182 RepID=UPI0036E99B58
MTERIDHVGWAREFVRAAENAFDDEVTTTPRDEPTVSENIALAQVHATLAFVEQQRIANLIALASLPGTNGFEDAAYDARTAALMEGLLDSETVPAVPGYGPAGIDERVFIRPDIREGLGL